MANFPQKYDNISLSAPFLRKNSQFFQLLPVVERVQLGVPDVADQVPLDGLQLVD